MALSQEENVYGGIKFDDGCFMVECPDGERKKLVDFDDSKSDEDSEDIADLLPNDPFGMDFNIGLSDNPFGMDFDMSLPNDSFDMDFIEAMVVAVTGWIHDFDLKAYEFETDEAYEEKNNDDNAYFAELNFVCTSFMKYEQEEGQNKVVDAGLAMYTKDVLYEDDNMLGGDMEDLTCFGCEKYQSDYVEDYNDDNEGAPPAALSFALGYLEVDDLFSVERVCKSLRYDVQIDPLLWRTIRIDYPLSLKITNDDLVWLTNRAQGTLSSLTLLQCMKITNIGLKQVLENNRGLTKLSVPGCVNLDIEGFINDLKVFNSVARPGIRRLRLCDLNIKKNQLEEFKLLLGEDDIKSSNYKPRFYGRGRLYVPLDDERAIDIEVCPRCQKVGQVYDCPAKTCQENTRPEEKCKGCSLCIARCIGCGCCLDNKPYEETALLELLCFDCVAKLLNCQDKVAVPSHTYYSQRIRYRFYRYS